MALSTGDTVALICFFPYRSGENNARYRRLRARGHNLTLNKHLLWAVCLCTSQYRFWYEEQSSHQARLMPLFWGASTIAIPKRDRRNTGILTQITTFEYPDVTRPISLKSITQLFHYLPWRMLETSRNTCVTSLAQQPQNPPSKSFLALTVSPQFVCDAGLHNQVGH